MTQGIDDFELKPEVIHWLLQRQRRCVNCSSMDNLEVHHRIFRSEGEEGLKRFLNVQADFFTIHKEHKWTLHSVQNLVILCRNCHQWRVHSWDRILREKFRNSFTDAFTGFNIFFQRKVKSPF